MTIAEFVAEFHEAFGQYFGDGQSDNLCRAKLHDEEHLELLDELAVDNRPGIAKELADVVYVAYGTAFSLGIDLDAVISAVHASNMTKVDDSGRFVLNNAGKVVKGPNYRPPDIAALLDGAR